MALFFPAFFDHPENIRFSEQEADEKIELFLRQHWFVNVGWILLALFALFLPIIVLQLDITLNTNYFLNVPIGIVIGGLIIWYLLVTAYIMEKFLFWYFNIYILTNYHLVDVNFHNLLNRDITEAGIENVESASSKISGIIGSLFNFGDVIVQTAAENQQITFLKVPFPDVVSDRINDLRMDKKQ